MTNDPHVAGVRGPANAPQQLKARERVRIVPSFLVQGSAVEGWLGEETAFGVAVEVDTSDWFQPTSTGVERRFYPWSSVAYLVRKPEEAIRDQF